VRISILQLCNYAINEVLIMKLQNCRTAELCRHGVRDEHPRSAIAERDKIDLPQPSALGDDPCQSDTLRRSIIFVTPSATVQLFNGPTA
jgi:hypothetical protein